MPILFDYGRPYVPQTPKYIADQPIQHCALPPPRPLQVFTLFMNGPLVLGNYTVDVYETKKNKTKLFLLPLIVIMVLSMLFLSSLLFSETTEELTLLLICFLATTAFSILLLLRHSKMFVDMPHYCQFDFDHVLKL